MQQGTRMTGQFREFERDARRTHAGLLAIVASTALLALLSVMSLGCASGRESFDDRSIPWPEPTAHLQIDYPARVYPVQTAIGTTLEQPPQPTLAAASSEPEAPTTAALMEEIFPTQSLRLSEMLSMFRETPRMAALRTTLNVIHADRMQAELLLNPEFHYERFVTMTGDSDAANDPNQFSVSQPLLLFGQRGAAIMTADLELSAAQAEVFAEYADLVFQVKHRFASLSVREEAVRVLRESLEHFDRAERLVEGRFLEGDVRERTFPCATWLISAKPPDGPSFRASKTAVIWRSSSMPKAVTWARSSAIPSQRSGSTCNHPKAITSCGRASSRINSEPSPDCKSSSPSRRSWCWDCSTAP